MTGLVFGVALAIVMGPFEASAKRKLVFDKTVKCPSGWVDAKVERNSLASAYQLSVHNRTNGTVRVFVKGEATLVCRNCPQKGQTQRGADTMDVSAGGRDRQPFIATMHELENFRLRDFGVSCNTGRKSISGRVGSGSGNSGSSRHRGGSSRKKRTCRLPKVLEWRGQCYKRCPKGTVRSGRRCVLSARAKSVVVVAMKSFGKGPASKNAGRNKNEISAANA